MAVLVRAWSPPTADSAYGGRLRREIDCLTGVSYKRSFSQVGGAAAQRGLIAQSKSSEVRELSL
jgi:hypothetical protein